jgi:hypothetical protein
MPAKIIKFGQITEDAFGGLVFQDFHIDMDGRFDISDTSDTSDIEVVILELVIERLKLERADITAIAQALESGGAQMDAALIRLGS